MAQVMETNNNRERRIRFFCNYSLADLSFGFSDIFLRYQNPDIRRTAKNPGNQSYLFHGGDNCKPEGRQPLF